MYIGCVIKYIPSRHGRQGNLSTVSWTYEASIAIWTIRSIFLPLTLNEVTWYLSPFMLGIIVIEGNKDAYLNRSDIEEFYFVNVAVFVLYDSLNY